MSHYPIKWHKTSHGYNKDDGTPIRHRESFILIYEGGAVEGWRTPTAQSFDEPGPGHYGGIEIHSKTPNRAEQAVSGGYCEWTKGDCYHDGSSLAFEQIEWCFDNPEYMFDVLGEWAETNLGASSELSA